jgi:hypothetical protein
MVKRILVGAAGALAVAVFANVVIDSTESAAAPRHFNGPVSYATNLAEVFRRAGVYTGRILKGAMPQDLPVMQESKLSWSLTTRSQDCSASRCLPPCWPAPTR